MTNPRWSLLVASSRSLRKASLLRRSMLMLWSDLNSKSHPDLPLALMISWSYILYVVWNKRARSRIGRVLENLRKARQRCLLEVIGMSLYTETIILVSMCSRGVCGSWEAAYRSEWNREHIIKQPDRKHQFCFAVDCIIKLKRHGTSFFNAHLYIA